VNDHVERLAVELPGQARGAFDARDVQCERRRTKLAQRGERTLVARGARDGPALGSVLANEFATDAARGTIIVTEAKA